ncbi:nitrate- and nitrite sensing domain-containing protein [Streptomyces sp. JJ36]|uniref:sensor histidine kinase n=1 Tax=Streptomyces sp. JJ36 TaxID=2736645 RepID=UPI001F191E3B|nr:nitrate- and nitrite sensing domain-containing protein [Streptomyces sp. JJ36]MCF6524663.1 nitrate- and nitrite sensing domain-containing protein [Streptomyces sp. JJ36]
MRNRLLVSVALCCVAVAAAGAPGLVSASGALSDAQDLVDRATLNQRAVALAHSLSDERDDVVEFAAAGRAGAAAAEPSASQQARVDRQITEVLAADELPRPLVRSLHELPETRQQALSGESTPLEVYEAYSAALEQLLAVSRTVAQGIASDPGAGFASPETSAVATAEALPHLGRAVEQAGATRGLLRGALAGDGAQPALTGEAQLAHVREQAALADFEQTAGTEARETYGKTVTGTDVELADRYLARLTDAPALSAEDRGLDPERVAAALSARIDRMRGVHSSLATAEVARLEGERDDAVTALELRVGLVAACLLLATGISVQTARSLARPLSVLRRGSQRLAGDPAGAEPVRFTGRNDEFADVVRALNTLRETAATLHRRAGDAEADRDRLRDESGELAAERDRLRQEQEALREQLEAGRGAVHGTFVHLALRTLGLVERQLGIIESLEAEEADPDRLDTLFKLDHLATRMRRHSENLLLLAGAEHTTTHHSGPVPLLDVLRAGISEIERYERVQLASLPPHVQVAGFAADDLSHLLAELLDNATAFSAPDADVELSGWLLENGEIMLSVQDQGIGVTAERLADLNARLGAPEQQQPPGAEGADEPGTGLGMGLYVVARLATRHGLRVQLREQKQGGIAAVVVVPRTLLPDRPAPGGTVPRGDTPGAGTAPSLPGSVAEANSNTLPRRAGPAAPTTHGTGSAPETAPREPTTHTTGPADAQAATGVPGDAAEAPTGDRPDPGPPTDGGAPETSGAPETGAAPSGAGLSGAADGAAAEDPLGAGPGSAPGAAPADGGEEPAYSAYSALEGAFGAPHGGAPEPSAADAAGPERPVVPQPRRPAPAEPGTGASPQSAGPDPVGPGPAGPVAADAESAGAGPARRESADPVPPGPESAPPGPAGPAGHDPDAGGVPGPAAPAPDPAGSPAGTPEETPAADVAPAAEPTPTHTDKGLPKRTPRHVTAAGAPARPRKSGANADELRRRLGGFQRGAQDGHRDAAAENRERGEEEETRR